MSACWAVTGGFLADCGMTVTTVGVIVVIQWQRTDRIRQAQQLVLLRRVRENEEIRQDLLRRARDFTDQTCPLPVNTTKSPTFRDDPPSACTRLDSDCARTDVTE